MGRPSSLLTTAVVTICLVLVLNGLALSAQQPAYDYDNIRDLYELLLRNEGYPASNTRYAHQMERKGGRSPTLRLRFGKRSDPYWASSSGQKVFDTTAENRS